MRNSLLLLAALVLALPALAAGATGAPVVGTSAEAVDLRTVDGATPYEDGWAVPLEGAKPSWLTPELEARLATGEVLAAPAQAPLPSEIGIRPGSWMIAPAGCTMNFIFQKSASYAIGTAGHCVDKVGEAVTLITLAPGGANPVLVDVGTVIARHDNGVGDDFALVSVRPKLNSWVDPTIAVVGGPCGRVYRLRA